MDPTMQSPIVKRFAGVEFEIPSGPHSYSVTKYIGSVTDGITPEMAFQMLRRHATPFQGVAVSNGGPPTDIRGLGPVQHIVDPDRLTIVSTTTPDHKLSPGNVFRSIVQKGNDLYVVTLGYGTGV